MLRFYGSLTGAARNLTAGVDITVLKRGNQLNMGQRELLVRPVEVDEIEAALNSIGDMTAPGVDGFGSKFIKQGWYILKGDVIKVVMDFF